MGVSRGYSFPSELGGAANKGYCDNYWHPTGDRWYQLLSAADAYAAETAGVRCAYAFGRGANTGTHYGFPLCLDISEDGI